MLRRHNFMSKATTHSRGQHLLARARDQPWCGCCMLRSHSICPGFKYPISQAGRRTAVGYTRRHGGPTDRRVLNSLREQKGFQTAVGTLRCSACRLRPAQRRVWESFCRSAILIARAKTFLRGHRLSSQ